LIQLQPGVSQGGEVDGQRTSAQNITRDGLNVQDNFIREGNFNPDRPRIDDLSEFTIVTQIANPSLGSGGTSQVQYVTARGGAQFHGLSTNTIKMPPWLPTVSLTTEWSCQTSI
jgi:hypothetical protein